MQALATYTLKINKPFVADDLQKGLYLVIVHANRIPPHIGIIADKTYHSLTIKGQEINVPVEVLVRNKLQRKIASVFIKLKKHPVFSDNYLKEHFISNVLQFNKVEVGKATCLSPIKLFFEENFDVDTRNVQYIFELLPQLEAKGLIETVSALFIDEKSFQLPYYNMEQLNKGIDAAQQEAHTIKKAIAPKGADLN